MDSEQIGVIIKEILANKKNHVLFLGCILNDEYINFPSIDKNFFFIVNTNEKSNIDIMGHWILLFFRNKSLFFFDSFALDPSEYGGSIEYYFYNHNNSKYKMAKYQIQNINSLLCGAYCIYISSMLARNLPLKRIMKIFSRQTCQNDKFIQRFILSFPCMIKNDKCHNK